jgi:hypothetical protein
MMKRQWRSVLVAAVLSVGWMPTQVVGQAHSPDHEAIRDVVMRGYVQGIHGNGERAVIRAAFHPRFVMKVLGADGSVADVTIEQWIARLPPEGEPPAQMTTGEIPRVMQAGNAAVAEVQMSRNGEKVFTDYISLYRFPEGWRMIAKVFHSYPAS